MTTLGEKVGALLPRFRAQAESLMVDTCRITGPGTLGTWDANAGTYVGATPGPTVYEGVCRLRRPAPNPQNADAGEAVWAVDVLILSLPVDGSEDVADGHTVEMLTSAFDPAAVGLLLTVQTGHWQTHSTARRVPVKVATRDA